MRASFNRALTNAGSWLSRPEPVVAVGVYIGLWLIFDRESFNWQAVASIATLLMTLFIQRSEHRDTQAIHAKLDELLRAHGDAKKSLTTLDDKEPEQIEAFRKKVRRRPINRQSSGVASQIQSSNRRKHLMADNRDPNEKQPGEKPEGKYHYNPGNQSDKAIEITKPESEQENNVDRINSRRKDQKQG
jgi:low affinity Fe/Cu permease